MQLGPGVTFDRYVIEALLGEGGMGRVYRARDPRLERKVALKVLRPPGERPPDATYATLSSEGAARLLREARAAAALDHPNAVAVFDVGEFERVPFIAMELLEGRTLRAFIGDPNVSMTRRVRWLTDVARALAAAHVRGLVHRDVKPENVMVRNDGVVKVLDFGIARRIDFVTEGDAATHEMLATAQGALVGTPLYMAPEQFRGEPVDGRSDQFSWAVVAYELLSGAPPWHVAGRGLRLVSEILSTDPPPLSGPDLAASVAATVRKAMAKAPRDRFAAMEEVIDALEPHGAWSGRDVHPIASTEPPPPPPAVATSHDGPAWLTGAGRSRRAALAGGALAVLGLAAWTGWLARRPASPVAVAPPPAVSSPSSAPVTLDDAPLPDTENPRAAAAYRAALQSLRDASVMSAVASLRRAFELDPGLAPAALRLAWLYATQGNLAEARGWLAKAREARGSLAARDREILTLVEAHALAQPPDAVTACRLAADASARAPGDVEIAFLHARYAQLAGDSDGAAEALDRAAALDPRFALVWWARAIAAEDRGDIGGAEAAYDACIGVSPGAASCLRSRAVHVAQRGDCPGLERDARRLVSVEPEGPRAYEFLARALAAVGKPVDAVRGALEQRWRLLPPDRAGAAQLADEARLAMLEGDFATAVARAQDLKALVRGSRTEIDHAEPALLLVQAYGESGDDARAGAIADEVWRQRDAWIAARPLGDTSVSDAIPTILAVARRTGKLSPAAFAAARADWLHEAEASLSPLWRRELWNAAYAGPAETAEEAREALAALPAYEPLPPARELRGLDAATGKVYALAGRSDEALPYLRRGVAACLVLDEPVAHTRAELLLGEALEPTDRAGACAAYAHVLARWGGARPRSRTADEARRRARPLGCDRGAAP